MEYLRLYTDTPHLNVMWQAVAVIIVMIAMLYGWRAVYQGGNILKRADTPAVADRQLFIYFIVAWSLSVFYVIERDYWSYMQVSMGFYPNRLGNHYEPLYQWLSNLITNYTLWRALIWGIASALMMLTIRRANVSVTSTLLFVTLLYLSSFGAFRNVLGFSVLYYALALWTNPGEKHPLALRLCAVALAVLSLWTHTTMPVTLLIVLIASLRVTKRGLYWILIVTVCTYILLFFSITWLQSLVPSDNGIVSPTDRVREYILGSNEPLTPYSICMRLFMTSPIWAALGLATYRLYFKPDREEEPSRLIRWCYNIALLSSCGVSVFLIPGLSQWIYLRVQIMGVFPLILVLGWIYNSPRTRLQQIILLYLLAFYAWSLWRVGKRILLIHDFF